MAHNYDVGTRAWQPDTTEGWVASEVESKTVEGDKVKLVFQLVNGEVSFSPNQWPLWTWLTRMNTVKNDENNRGCTSGE